MTIWTSTQKLPASKELKMMIAFRPSQKTLISVRNISSLCHYIHQQTIYRHGTANQTFLVAASQIIYVRVWCASGEFTSGAPSQLTLDGEEQLVLSIMQHIYGRRFEVTIIAIILARRSNINIGHQCTSRGLQRWRPSLAQGSGKVTVRRRVRLLSYSRGCVQLFLIRDEHTKRQKHQQLKLTLCAICKQQKALLT